MKKWNMVVDVRKCVGCYNCFLSCKDEHIGNEYPGYAKPQPAHGHNWINIELVERGQVPMVDMTYIPKMCNHCDDAPCIKAGKGAVYKRDDGIVIIDPDKAKGRKDIVNSCPYGAIYWNEEQQVPQAWYFDAHLLDQGSKEPRCTQACPTGALKAFKVSDNEMQQLVKTENLSDIEPEYQTRPRVHYKNLEQVRCSFVAGTVITEDNGIQEAVEGAEIHLLRGAENVGETKTDNYGDFKLDGISDSGTCRLVIDKEGYNSQSYDIELSGSINFGTVMLLPVAVQSPQYAEAVAG